MWALGVISIRDIYRLERRIGDVVGRDVPALTVYQLQAPPKPQVLSRNQTIVRMCSQVYAVRAAPMLVCAVDLSLPFLCSKIQWLLMRDMRQTPL